MKNNSGYGHVLKYTSLFGGVQGMGILINLVRNKLVALLLGPAGMGLASLYTTAVNFVSQATSLGLSFSAVRHLSELYDHGDAARVVRFVKVIRGWSLVTALAGTLIFILLAPLLSSDLFGRIAHAYHFVLLSPMVGMMAVTGGETAILKSACRLKSLAVVQMLAVVAALVVSVPFYYYFGMDGIIPVLLATSLATLLLTLRCSCKVCPYVLRGSRGILGEGMGMVRLGVAFVLAGILGSGAEMAIRTFLNAGGSLDMVGLYNAGYMLTITYSGMVFSAMETDYFPRLSAVNHDLAAMRDMVNRQVEVSLLLVSPMLCVLIVFLPLLLPLLYSRCFLEVVAMGQVAALSMYFKAVTLPVEYVNLARGDSRSYLLLEAAFDVLMVAAIVVGYRLFGLWGTGLALSVTHLLNVLMVVLYARRRYAYKVSRKVVAYMAIQYALGALTYASTFVRYDGLRWSLGVLAALASGVFSLYIIIYQQTSLWSVLKKKVLRHG